MFRDYMRQRLGMGNGGASLPTPNQMNPGVSLPAPTPWGQPPTTFQPKQPGAVLPVENPIYPSDPGNGAILPIENPIYQPKANPITTQPMKRQTGPYNPYSF